MKDASDPILLCGYIGIGFVLVPCLNLEIIALSAFWICFIGKKVSLKYSLLVILAFRISRYIIFSTYQIYIIFRCIVKFIYVHKLK
jgi:hypothetical protein